ncbi:MAG: hypothetical protein NVSMB39_6380 [Candidatus Saccharimonadales bacterium]
MDESAAYSFRLVAGKSESYDRCRLIERTAKAFDLLLVLLQAHGPRHVRFYIGVKGHPNNVTGFLVNLCGFDPRTRDDE